MAHINPRLNPQATKIRDITRSVLPCKAASRLEAKKFKQQGNQLVRRKLNSKLLIAQNQGCACADAAVLHCPVCDFFYDPRDFQYGNFFLWWRNYSVVEFRRDHERTSIVIRWANFHRAGKDDHQWVTFVSQAFPKDLIGRHAVFHIFQANDIDEFLRQHAV